MSLDLIKFSEHQHLVSDNTTTTTTTNSPDVHQHAVHRQRRLHWAGPAGCHHSLAAGIQEPPRVQRPGVIPEKHQR